MSNYLLPIIIVPDHPSTDWSEWDAAVYLLRTPFIADKTAPFIDEERRTIDFDGLREKDWPYWSSGEQLLVRFAQDMWDGRGAVNMLDVVATLDEGNFDRVRIALAIRARRAVGREA